MNFEAEFSALKSEYHDKLRTLVEKQLSAMLGAVTAPIAAPVKRGPGRPKGSGVKVTAVTGKGPCGKAGCVKPVIAKGLCRNHYQQMRTKVRAKEAAKAVAKAEAEKELAEMVTRIQPNGEPPVYGQATTTIA